MANLNGLIVVTLSSGACGLKVLAWSHLIVLYTSFAAPVEGTKICKGRLTY